MKKLQNRHDVFVMLGHPTFLLLVGLMWLLPTPSISQPLASKKPKFVGNVVSNGNSIRNDFAAYWNQVTPENAGKWGSVQYDTNKVYNWTQLDNIYNYAQARGFPYRHHTLVWGQQEPSFVMTLDSARQYDQVASWIQAVGQRYPNMDFCDVVNEPLHAPPSYKNALGGNGATGWDWVITAFELARLYLPNTQLFLNEYSVINNGSATAQYLQIINLLNDRGLIDGIGVQGHYFEINTSAAVLYNNLTTLASSDLPIHITELDIEEADDNTQLSRYQTLFPALYEHPGVTGITLWGYVRYEIWRANAYLLTERLVERPALQWLRTYLAAPFRPTLVSPVGTSGELRNPQLVWTASDSAASYHVQVSLSGSFSSTVVDSVVQDTVIQVGLLSANTMYYWRASSRSAAGDESPFTAPASFRTGDQVNAVGDSGPVLSEYSLAQNYPNPFNPTTVIRYELPTSSHVRLTVYSILGTKIRALVDAALSAGEHTAVWDAKDDFNSDVASGIYFYSLQTENATFIRKMVLLR